MKKIKFGSLIVGLATAGLLFSTVACTKNNENAKAEDDKTILVFGASRGEEAARLEEIIKVFNEKTGYNVVYEGSPEFETQIQVQATAGTPPDIAMLPQPGMMQNFAEAGYIKPLPANVTKRIDSNYASVWKDLGSYKGQTYGVFHRVNAKSFVWYNKAEWAKRGYSIPKTWDELKALEEKMVADGIAPWTVGFESGAASGWPGTDWLEDMMLRTAGPDVYDKWVKHEIPFDAPEVENAMNYIGEIFFNDNYVYGGRTNILTSHYGDSIKPLFENPPKAMMHREGNFITGFLPESVQANMEAEVGVFALPSVDEKWGTPVLGGGDQFVMFTEKPGVAEFLEFLTTWEGCIPWAKVGGALFPHKDQNFADYGNGIERQLAEILVNAKVFRFDGSDQMPAEVGSGTFWTGMVNWVSGTEDTKDALKTINESWPQ